MKILVCVKQVPDTETKLKLTGDKVDLTGIKWVMNPYDEFAVEEALKIKATQPTAEIHVITVGPKARAADVLRTALAMGADEGILVDAPENLDSYATAKCLAAADKQVGAFDLVFTGKLAIDDNAAAVSQLVAEFLEIPHATGISKAEYQAGATVVEREIEGGAREIIELKGPALIGANKGLNTPRYASLPGIMKAKKKVLKEFSHEALGVTPTDVKVTFSSYQLPPDRPAAQLLTGDAATQAKDLVRRLREEAKVI